MAETESICCWCGTPLGGKRRHARFCSPRCRRESFGAEPCYYCGLPAEGRDHIIPRAMRDAVALRWPHLTHKFSETVPACTECNSLAGARLFPTLGAKRRWLKRRLRTRYANLLASPAWTDAEIAELGYGLRTHVQRSHEAKKLTHARLRWPRI